METRYVIKKSGERELYDPQKVSRSLMNSGADEETTRIILQKLNRKIYDGIDTRKIFKFVFKELGKREKIVGTRYNLKKGIMDMTLGGGFLFEKYMARVFEKLGYSVELNKEIRGKIIPHEIDIVAKKGKEKTLVECKHFSVKDSVVSIQTALYVYARFLDLKNTFNSVFLVTNSKFSQQVVQYSKGVGLKLLGWKHPEGNSLENLIEKYKIYPITILPLKHKIIKGYLEREILTFQELSKEKDLPSNVREIVNKMLDLKD